jgi:hypothetical protein
MKEVVDYLAERKSEFSRHMVIARIIESRVNDKTSGTSAKVEVRHVNTLKSGLIIHLYNIVEATLTRSLTAVGDCILAERPARWTEGVLKEWVRAEVWSAEEKIGAKALENFTKISGMLAAGGNVPAFSVKGEPGSWTDKGIEKIAQRLGCKLVLSAAIKKDALSKTYKDQTNAFEFLANRRNAIAHGNVTFEEGANQMSLDELQKLADRIIPFLLAVVESYQTYVETKAYLTSTESAE